LIRINSLQTKKCDNFKKKNLETKNQLGHRVIKKLAVYGAPAPPPRMEP